MGIAGLYRTGKSFLLNRLLGPLARFRWDQILATGASCLTEPPVKLMCSRREKLIVDSLTLEADPEEPLKSMQNVAVAIKQGDFITLM